MPAGPCHRRLHRARRRRTMRTMRGTIPTFIALPDRSAVPDGRFRDHGRAALAHPVEEHGRRRAPDASGACAARPERPVAPWRADFRRRAVPASTRHAPGRRT